MFDYKNKGLRFVREVIIEKARRDAKDLEPFNDHIASRAWGSLITDISTVLWQHVNWGDSLIKIAAIAWCASEQFQQSMDTKRKQWNYHVEDGVAVTGEGYVWGWGKDVEEATDDWVKKASARWPDEHEHWLSAFKTEEARTANYIDQGAIDEMLERARDRYNDWHANNDPDPIWQKFRGRQEELIELIGDVVDGWFEAQGGQWSHPRVPVGDAVDEFTVKITPTGEWTRDE